MISAEGLSAFTFLYIQTIKMMCLIAVSLYIEVVSSVAIIHQCIVIKSSGNKGEAEIYECYINLPC